MIPSSFDYIQATTVEEAIQLLQETNGEGKLIAGGHSLIPLMKFRLTSPSKLIDIAQIAELRGIKLENQRLIVGALTTHRDLCKSSLVQEQIPVLAETARQIGDLQVRSRGTVGGNIAHADPAADLPGVALALDCTVTWHGEEGTEQAQAEDFFLGPLITALPENSVLTSVSFAVPPKHAKSVYLKFPHPASGYAVIGVCVLVGKNEQGAIDFIRVAINGVSDMAYRAVSVENALLGEQATEANVLKAAAQAARDAEMGEDLFASAEYRQQLCRVYTKRALSQVLL
ncbi:xanthine dehydrogenase family protein subunit M [Ammoniphilus sp. YIM 78166]|uniref:FAD binding domain-containing protein n=1 Tax=Ammoniphilus sp. YIM 78166 TaxID=1644106 RepID=UPI0010704219|nr:xanthine dehydrogenase family protein subunit M [Ammoniphilus sp. YIM 78166]